MTFTSINGAPQGAPYLTPSIVWLGAEFENVPKTSRTAEEINHIRRAGELISRVRGLEFYMSEVVAGTAFDLVSTCCKTPVKDVPSDGNAPVVCATCGREHGLAKHVQTLGAWLVVEAGRKKRPLNRHQRRLVELELARL